MVCAYSDLNYRKKTPKNSLLSHTTVLFVHLKSEIIVLHRFTVQYSTQKCIQAFQMCQLASASLRDHSFLTKRAKPESWHTHKTTYTSRKKSKSEPDPITHKRAFFISHDSAVWLFTSRLSHLYLFSSMKDGPNALWETRFPDRKGDRDRQIGTEVQTWCPLPLWKPANETLRCIHSQQ